MKSYPLVLLLLLCWYVTATPELWYFDHSCLTWTLPMHLAYLPTSALTSLQQRPYLFDQLSWQSHGNWDSHPSDSQWAWRWQSPLLVLLVSEMVDLQPLRSVNYLSSLCQHHPTTINVSPVRTSDCQCAFSLMRPSNVLRTDTHDPVVMVIGCWALVS